MRHATGSLVLYSAITGMMTTAAVSLIIGRHPAAGALAVLVGVASLARAIRSGRARD
jgi:hypothetical protein